MLTSTDIKLNFRNMDSQADSFWWKHALVSSSPRTSRPVRLFLRGLIHHHSDSYYLYKARIWSVLQDAAFGQCQSGQLVDGRFRDLVDDQSVFSSPDTLTECLHNILSNEPSAIYIVTANVSVQAVKALCGLNLFDAKKITVLGVPRLNKRQQMLKALQRVQTSVTVFVDDDVFWPQDYLKYLLACFEDPATGAAGTRQRVVRKDPSSMWNYLAIGYLERRVWNNICTNAVDGSISTLSGRTAAYLTKLLKNERFFFYFQNDSWKGVPLTTDDDKALTRWIFSQGYNITIQCDSRSVVETTMEEGEKFLYQCTRWARGHFRGNFIVMKKETYWRARKYAWGCYIIYFGQYQTPAFAFDGILVALLYQATRPCPSHASTAFIILGCWLFFTKIMKMIPHFIRHPTDMRFIPLSILFSYLHGFVNMYAWFTLRTTAWGSQNLTKLEESCFSAPSIDAWPELNLHNFDDGKWSSVSTASPKND
nr:hyaluronan synthase [Quercus suber]